MTAHETQPRSAARALKATRELRLAGVPASPGVAIGYAHVIPLDLPPVVRREIRPDEVEDERRRLALALDGTRRELLDIREKLRKLRGGEEAKIFDAHLLMLDDPEVTRRAGERIATERLNAEAAFFDAVTEVLQAMEAIEDSYLRERAADVRDVKRRVLKNLGERSRHPLGNLQEGSIVIAHDLSPTITAELDPARVSGLATEAGSRTSHTAILARSLEIPAVVGLERLLADVQQGEPLVLDAREGLLIRNPTEDTLEHYHRVELEIQRGRTRALQVRELPSRTRDGTPFAVQANIEIPREIGVARLFGAEGIGLFRTEFLFMQAGGFPDEEQQFSIYRQIVEGMRGQPVTIRTLDLGGDKMPTDPYAAPEANPFLGWRAIRYSLDHPQIFRDQLRAILRSSAHGRVRVMFPLVTAVEELRRARAVADDVWRELAGEGHPLGEPVAIGAMVETPGAALVASALAREADFLSIGTNDLTQYTLAVDRGNMRVADLFQTFHPAVLLLIERTIRAGRAAGIEVALCGEMAASARAAVLLLGMGLRTLSMIASKIPRVKTVLRETTVAEAEELWRDCRELETAAEVEDRIQARFGARFQTLPAGHEDGEDEDEMVEGGERVKDGGRGTMAGGGATMADSDGTAEDRNGGDLP